MDLDEEKWHLSPNHKINHSSDNKNQTCEEEIELFTPNKEKFTPNSPKSSFSINGDEIYTPDKENMTPKSSLSKPSKEMGKLKEIKHRLSISSPLKNVVGSTSSASDNQVLQDHKYTSLAPTKQARLILQEIAPKVPFQCLEEDHSQFKPIHKEENKSWTVVVDTASLVDKESRKALQLLQGLKCTNLIVPGIVMRELDCMKKRGTFFKRINEAALALNWIEECMNETKWWIHVQSVLEEVKSTENKIIWGSKWNLFSPCISLTPEDHILLECALLFKKNVSNGGFVLLSDDVTLKIKA